jgi:hypothetical protein
MRGHNEAPLRERVVGGIRVMVRLQVARIAASGTILLMVALAGMLAMAFGASPALAESQISLYGGWNGSFDSDIHLIQPGGTNMTLKDVPWDGDSFGPPPCWGLRGTYWLNSAPNWGLMIDYNYAKVIADQSAVVGVSGTRDGVKLGPTDRVGNTFETMDSTDGLNELFLADSIAGCMSAGRLISGLASARLFRMSRCGGRLGRPIHAPSTISSTA